MLLIWSMYFFGKSRERNFRTTYVKGVRVVFIRNKELQRSLREEGTLGFTVRRTIFVRSTYVYTPRLLRHELTHVKQHDRDPWFLVKYWYHYITTGYYNNPYEREARRAE